MWSYPNVFLLTFNRERQYFYQGVQILTSKETKSIVGLFLDFTYVILKGPNKRFNRKKARQQGLACMHIHQPLEPLYSMCNYLEADPNNVLSTYFTHSVQHAR